MSLFLVIDDNRVTRQSLSWLIEAQGHQTIAAKTVEEGIKKLDLNPTHVVLDMHLEDGEGISILRHIRNEGLPMRVAVLTGTSDEQQLDEAKNLEADAVFRKPEWTGLMSWIAEDRNSATEKFESPCHA